MLLLWSSDRYAVYRNIELGWIHLIANFRSPWVFNRFGWFGIRLVWYVLQLAINSSACIGIFTFKMCFIWFCLAFLLNSFDVIVSFVLEFFQGKRKRLIASMIMKPLLFFKLFDCSCIMIIYIMIQKIWHPNSYKSQLLLFMRGIWWCMLNAEFWSQLTFYFFYMYLYSNWTNVSAQYCICWGRMQSEIILNRWWDKKLKIFFKIKLKIQNPQSKRDFVVRIDRRNCEKWEGRAKTTTEPSIIKKYLAIGGFRAQTKFFKTLKLSSRERLPSARDYRKTWALISEI